MVAGTVWKKNKQKKNKKKNNNFGLCILQLFGVEFSFNLFDETDPSHKIRLWWNYIPNIKDLGLLVSQEDYTSISPYESI